MHKSNINSQPYKTIALSFVLLASFYNQAAHDANQRTTETSSTHSATQEMQLTAQTLAVDALKTRERSSRSLLRQTQALADEQSEGEYERDTWKWRDKADKHHDVSWCELLCSLCCPKSETE